MASDLQVFRPSGHVCVFVGQAAQESFPADLPAIGVRHRGRGSVKFVVGDTLRYALLRPGRVAVRLVLGQDSAQILFAEDQRAAQKIAALGADRHILVRMADLPVPRGGLGMAARRRPP